MKSSQFNSVIPFQDKYILYNSLTGKMLLLDGSLKRLMDEAKDDVSILKVNQPKLVDALIDKKFWVEKDIDEPALVKEKINQARNNPKEYILTINPTMNCNFKCWYCYEDHIKGSKMSEETLTRVKRHIKHVAETHTRLEQFCLSFFGGEPLLYFDHVCHPLIEEWRTLTDRHQVKKTLSFTTNGYLINDRFISLLKEYAANTYLQITLDGYKNDHNKVRYASVKQGSYDTIIENIVKLCDAGFQIILRINYTAENLENCYRILHDLEAIEHDCRKNIVVSFHSVWQEGEKTRDKRKELFAQVDAFITKGFTVNTSGDLRGINALCYADKQNTAVVNFNGDVFKCTARKFDTTNREGCLNENGEIVWDDEKKNIRLNTAFVRESCTSCRILPVCYGGCGQNKIENKDAKFCMYEFDDTWIDHVILNHIEQILKSQKYKSNKC